MSNEIKTKARATTIAELNRLHVLPLKPNPTISLTELVKYYTDELEMTVEHPGGGEAHCVVCSSHLGEHKALVFHSGYLHPGTVCRITLPTVWGSSAHAKGVIEACWHISGRIHGVLVCFSEARDLTRHIPTEQLPKRFDDEAEKNISLEGECLSIVSDPLEQEIITHIVKKTGFSVVHSNEPGDAIDQIRQRSICLVVVDDQAGDIPEFIQAVRQVGFSGRILVVSASSENSTVQNLRSAGADEVISRPYNSIDIVTCIRQLFSGGSAGDIEPIGSTLLPNTNLESTITKYTDHITETAVRIRNATAKGDLDAVRSLAESIRLSGGSFGYMLLSESAADVLKQLDATCSVAESTVELQSLDRMCSRIKPSAA